MVPTEYSKTVRRGLQSIRFYKGLGNRQGVRAPYNEIMFFRRERPVTRNFQEKLSALQASGFTVSPAASGTSRVTRGDLALELKEAGGNVVVEGRAGVLMGDEIGVLVDG